MKTVEQVLDELAYYVIYTAFQIKNENGTSTGALSFTEDIIYKIEELKSEQKQVTK